MAVGSATVSDRAFRPLSFATSVPARLASSDPATRRILPRWACILLDHGTSIVGEI